MHSDPAGARSETLLFRGRLSDGRTAASREVDVRLEAGGVRIGAAGSAILWPYVEVTAAQPVRATQADVLLLSSMVPGATLFVEDRAFSAALATAAPHLTGRAYRRAGLMAAGPVGVFAAALAGAIIAFDLSPSKAVARLMPEAARDHLGRSVLTSLPVTQTCTAAEGRAALDTLVWRLRPELKGKAHKVSVLDWNLVNAFAVPGGSVVLTRAIIERAASADEIAGVLAHEMGHGMELHPEAGLVRSVGFWALIQMTFTGTPGAIGNVGSMVAQLAYSRGYEREADAIALRLMREAGISAQAFAGFFRRMEGTRRSGTSEQRRGRGFSDILDTHPATPQRIEAIEKQPVYPATPALTDTEWRAFKAICRSNSGVAGRVETTNTDIEPVKPNAEKALEDAKKRRDGAVASARSHGDVANAYMTARNWKEAAAEYSKAIEQEPQSAFYRYNRGRAHQNAGQSDQAIADYDAALRLNPRYSDAHAARGAINRLRNEVAAARRDLDAALAINPRNGYALYQRGLLNATEARWSESEQDFARVIAGEKGYALAYVRRAEALEKLQRRQDAINDYRDALAASPSSADATAAFRMARERLAALGAAERP